MALNTITSPSGGQTATQSPQSAAGTSSGVGGAQTSNVQSGTPSSLLNDQTGIALNNTALTTVNLNPSTTATTTLPQPAKHHVNFVLLGFSGLLIVTAIALFWAASRSVKSTT